MSTVQPSTGDITWMLLLALTEVDSCDIHDPDDPILTVVGTVPADIEITFDRSPGINNFILRVNGKQSFRVSVSQVEQV